MSRPHNQRDDAPTRLWARCAECDAAMDPDLGDLCDNCAWALGDEGEGL